MSPEPWFVPKVAAYLGISEDRVRQLMGCEIRAAKIGGQWRTTQRDVDTYVLRNTFGGDLPAAPGKRPRPARYLKGASP